MLWFRKLLKRKQIKKEVGSISARFIYKEDRPHYASGTPDHSLIISL